MTSLAPRAVIFDCDGVVVDSEPIAFDLLAADLALRGFVMDRALMERELLGGTMLAVYHRALALGADLPDDWVDLFYDKLYTRLAQGTPLIPGIMALLDRLDAAGIPYAMGSNGSPQKMEITLGQYPDLRARFDGRMFSGQVMGKPKPAPDLYLHAAASLRSPPETCVVIEDSPTGARAARAAGMRCYGYAPHPNPALAAEGAVLFTRMADLPNLLGLT